MSFKQHIEINNQHLYTMHTICQYGVKDVHVHVHFFVQIM